MSALINYVGNAKHNWVVGQRRHIGESPQSEKYNVCADVLCM